MNLDEPTFFARGLPAIADQAVNSLGNFLLTFLLARALHINDFGIYSLLFAAMMTANGLVNTLVGEPIRTLGVGRGARTGSAYLGAQLITAALLGTLAGMIVAGVLMLGFATRPRIAVIVGAAIACTGLFEALRALGAASHRWHSILAADCAAQGLKILIVMCAMTLGAANMDIGFGAILGSVLVGAIGLYAAGPRPMLPERAYFLTQLRSHFSFGKWLMLESVVFTLSTQLYLYLLALVVDVPSVGAYSAAQTLVNVVNLLWMGATSFSISTARAVLLQEGAYAWRRWLLNTGYSLLAVVTVILVGISLAAEPLLGSLFSPQYARYAYLVPVLAIAGVLTAGNSLLGATFRTIDMPQMGFHAKAVSAVVTLLISVPLVRHWGAMGAAVGMTITQLCWLSVYVWGLQRIHGDWVQRVDSLRLVHGPAAATDRA